MKTLLDQLTEMEDHETGTFRFNVQGELNRETGELLVMTNTINPVPGQAFSEADVTKIRDVLRRRNIKTPK